MKINIEKTTKRVSKKVAPEVSPKAIIDVVTKKTPRKNTNRIEKYRYQRPMGKLVSEKPPSEAKPRPSRKKVEKEPLVSSVPLDMLPVDERTDWDHTQKTLVKPYWKTPENIPVEPPSLDDWGLREIIAQPDEEGEFLEQEFGTKDPSEIERITAERIASGDYEEVIVGNTQGINGKEFNTPLKVSPEYGRTIPEDHYQNITETTIADETWHHEAGTASNSDHTTPLDTFQEQQTNVFFQTKRTHDPQKYFERRKGTAEKNSGHDNLKTLPVSKQERASRGFLSKLKNFWHELKDDTQLVAQEFGWDEAAELEKQAAQYQAHLKKTGKKQLDF